MNNIIQQQRIPQNIIVTPFDPLCSWCLHAQCLPQGEMSHGVCKIHEELVEEEARVRRRFPLLTPSASATMSAQSGFIACAAIAWGKTLAVKAIKALIV